MRVHYTNALLELEKTAIMKLEKWHNMEENVLKHKSRAQWVRAKLTDDKDIKQEIVAFYKSLMGSSNPSVLAVNRIVMRKGPVLTQQQRLAICMEVTDEEIYKGMCSAGDDKAPGVDGYNAVFYKKPWPLLMNNITRAIKEYFLHENMFKAFNFTSITSVPSKPLNSKRMISSSLLEEICLQRQALFQYFQISLVASGLQANLDKSSVYFGGVQDPEQVLIKQHLGFNIGELPFKYLGTPLSTKKLIFVQWIPLIEKIVAKITSWTAKKLSYAGRTQLVQSVLFGVQAYWSQIFVLPVNVLKAIDGYCKSYIWSGTNTITKKALVAWERVCLPILVGGLNLINKQLWNKAAIVKICWDLAIKQDKL
ncbi:uncharacterized protein LOC132057927 [Lycium ferocissimum]|uniref:uncharacterized protein LOC132057927 n=1 Tax=Lycium ferocissimum TaxID=112874 RepID=UPI0028160C09|nr:uncharacterized protein LOC132057927 [Lycium ferocissimum]